MTLPIMVQVGNIHLKWNHERQSKFLVNDYGGKYSKIK
jgi:hypothetical protein